MVEGRKLQFRTIINYLTVRTRVGRMEWEWDSNRQSAIATLTNGRVIVSKDSDFDTVIEIEDEELNTLEAINTGYTVYSDLASEANEFYEVARRSALKIDSKIESIIREISD